MHKVLTRTTYIGGHRFNTKFWKTRERKPDAEVVEMAVLPIIASLPGPQCHRLAARSAEADAGGRSRRSGNPKSDMTRGWDAKWAKEEIVRLTAPDVLGFYTHFEAAEVFAVPPGQPLPVNVFSIFVAEERASSLVSEEPGCVSLDPIRIRSLNGWIVLQLLILTPFGVRG